MQRETVTRMQSSVAHVAQPHPIALAMDYIASRLRSTAVTISYRHGNRGIDGHHQGTDSHRNYFSTLGGGLVMGQQWHQWQIEM
jgi:hypothetical protein